MSHYLIALYLHILGALGFFIALGLEWTSLRRMRASVDASEIRQWLSLANGSGRLGMPSMLLLLISGGLMTYSVWKGDGVVGRACAADRGDGGALAPAYGGH
jgi:hypothetical protein